MILKKFIPFVAFLFFVSVLNAEETIKVQTRFRTNPPAKVEPVKGTFPLVTFPDCKYRIEYKTIDLDPERTTLLIFDETRSRELAAAFDEMKPRINALAKKIESLGGRTIRMSQNNSKTLFEAMKDQIVLIAGVDGQTSKPESTFLLSKLADKGHRIFVLRDLIETTCPPNDPSVRARSRELVVNRIEKNVCPSISSTDFLGGPAFRCGADKRRHVVMIVSDDHYDAGRSFPLFAEYLMDRFPVYCSIVHGEGGSNFMEIDELDDADSMVVFIRRLQVPASLLTKFRKNLADGCGLVGFRTSSHAFDPRKDPDPGFATWPEFDKIVQGGNYHNHGKTEYGTDIVNVDKRKDHPILKGVAPARWHSIGSLYYTGPIARDAVVLQFGSNAKDPAEPLTWFRYYGEKKAKVAYTGLGHPDDFNHKPGLTLMTNLILWSAGVFDR